MRACGCVLCLRPRPGHLQARGSGDAAWVLTLMIGAALGAGHAGRRAGVGTCVRRPAGTFKAAFCRRADNGPVAGSRGLYVGSSRAIAGSAAGMLLRRAAHRLTVDPRGARFCLQTSPLGESCAALPRPRPLPCAPPSPEKLVRAVR